jgi:CUE domain
MSTIQGPHADAEPNSDFNNDPQTASENSVPGVTPKPNSPPPTIATPAHAVPATPTSTTTSTAATPIATMEQSGVDVTLNNATTQATNDPPNLPPPETPQDSPNLRIASLSAIFPNFDPSLLESVLDSVDGNEESAADILLDMSDPNYVSQVQPNQRGVQLVSL